MAEGNRPVDKIRVGDISATIWEQKNGFHSATLERNYKDKDGQWQSTNSFSARDLVVAAKVADMAAERMIALRSGQDMDQEQAQKQAWEEAYQQKLAHQNKQSM